LKMRVSWTVLPGWPQCTILWISASWVFRITGMSHQRLTSVIFWIESYAFCPGLALDYDSPICASHIARIIEMNHHAWNICWDGVLLTFCSG
jgi:hypothetical protein